MSYHVGLTGGIGSGKSTVAGLFQELGATVIDSDYISHSLTQAGGPAILPICAVFGEDYLDPNGALNRSRMRGTVFSDATARQRLEAILHPLIRAEMLHQAHAAAHAPYVLLVVPLLFEAKDYRSLVQRALVVDCPEEMQLARTMSRSGLTESAVRAIMAQQLTRAQRLSLADDVIHNDGDPGALRPQVAELHRSYLLRSSGSSPVRR